jgi:quinol monooxygenase YgiN
MLIESIGIIAPPDMRDEVLRGLRSLLEPTKTEAGCIDCRLYEDSTNACIFYLESYWTMEDDLSRHVSSEQYGELLSLISMSVQPPSIEFHQVDQTLGSEFIETVRHI